VLVVQLDRQLGRSGLAMLSQLCGIYFVRDTVGMDIFLHYYHGASTLCSHCVDDSRTAWRYRNSSEAEQGRRPATSAVEIWNDVSPVSGHARGTSCVASSCR